MALMIRLFTKQFAFAWQWGHRNVFFSAYLLEMTR